MGSLCRYRKVAKAEETRGNHRSEVMWNKARRHLCRGDSGKEEGLVDVGAEGHTQTISGTEKKKGIE